MAKCIGTHQGPNQLIAGFVQGTLIPCTEQALDGGDYCRSCQEKSDAYGRRMRASWAAAKSARDDVVDELRAKGHQIDGPCPPLNWRKLLDA